MALRVNKSALVRSQSTQNRRKNTFGERNREVDTGESARGSLPHEVDDAQVLKSDKSRTKSELVSNNRNDCRITAKLTNSSSLDNEPNVNNTRRTQAATGCLINSTRILQTNRVTDKSKFRR